MFDFHVRSRWPDGHARSLAAACKACNRVENRVLKGYKKRPEGMCANGHPRTPENVGFSNGKRYCSACNRAAYQRLKRLPGWYELKKEYDRIYLQQRRRKQGAKERQFKNRAPRGPDKANDNVELPIAPFQAWLGEKLERYGGILAVAHATGMTERTIARIVEGRDNGTLKVSVRLDTVDGALTKEGSTFLWDLYPQLYADAA